jgi:hypothetical protein
MVNISELKRNVEAWQSLVHVCRRWRCLVFASPRRLDLKLVCTSGTTSLDVWPALPLIVKGTVYSRTVDGIVDALGHSDRVCRIDLRITQGSQWDQVLAAMQVPFPSLTDLLLHCWDEPPVIPDTFLGGSAPRLRSLKIEWIPFPGIPILLSSATHLVDLDLSDIPYSGYNSPEAMATCLSVLTRLHTLSLSFSVESVYSRSGQRLPPITRSILPDLKSFSFKRANRYLDDLVALIDAPRLDHLFITFLLGQMNFDTSRASHLLQFISRTPRLQEPNEVHVTLDSNAEIKYFWASDDHARLCVEVFCEDSEVDLLPSSITQVCTMYLPPLLTVVSLRLDALTRDDQGDDVEDDQWLEPLHPFTAVKNLYLSKESAPGVADALQELMGNRISEVLPSLQNIFVEGLEPSGPFQETIEQFVTARQLSGHPIAISEWHKPNWN